MSENNNEIVFTSMDELSKYNATLLNGFVSYLNDRHKRKRDAFHCGARVQIISGEELVNDFNSGIIESMKNRAENTEE